MKLIFDFKEFGSAFIVLFAIIDITGSLPVLIDLKEKNRSVSPAKVSVYSLVILLVFFYVGNRMLGFFNVDVHSFAVAGSFVMFVIAIEMTFGVVIFKEEGASNNATIVPLVFPLIAGPGAFTTLLSLRSEYNSLNIVLALVANMLIVYFVIKNVGWVKRILGSGGIYILRKFFGVILLAISVKMFMGNIIYLTGK